MRTSTSGCSPSRRPTRVPVAAEDVEHPGGRPGLQAELGDPLHGQRGLLGGLQYDGATGGQGRSELPAAEGEWEVPRDDGGDHAGGFAGDQRQLAVVGRRDVAGLLVGQLAVEAQAADQCTELDLVGGADGLAHLQTDQQRDLGAVLVDQRGEALQDLPRARGCIRGHGPWSKARRAAATASSASAGWAQARSTRGCPSRADATALVDPSRAGRRVPSMNIPGIDAEHRRLGSSQSVEATGSTSPAFIRVAPHRRSAGRVGLTNPPNPNTFGP